MIQISKIDNNNNNSWLNDLYLDWIAWEDNNNNTNYMLDPAVSTNNIININFNPLKLNNNSITFNIYYNNSQQFIVNEPIILIQIESQLFQYITSLLNNNNKYFTLSFIYWSFERIVLKEYVTNNVNNPIIEGSLFNEIQQYYRTNYSQIYRIFNFNTIEYNYLR